MAFIVHVSDNTSDQFSAQSKTSQDDQFSLRIILHIAFLILIATKLYFEHFLEVLLLLWLFASTVYVYKAVREDALNRSHNGKAHHCLLVSFVAACYLLFLHFSLGDRGLYRIFAFIPPLIAVDNLWFVFWTCALVDGTIKIVLLLCKSILIAIPLHNLSTYKLGTSLAVLECCSLLLRSIYPCFIWILFFIEFHGSQQSPLFQKILLVTFYVLLKVGSLIYCLRSLKQIFKNLCSTSPPFTLESSSTQRCILCRRDCTRAGVLPCNHSTCEPCMETWCSRHTCCPTCNVNFSHQTQWRDGSMDLFVQLY